MINQSQNKEHGIALLFCLIALLILSAITASLILMSGTETNVNANYRSEETAFFAAKAGIYEALDRMQQSNANSIAASLPTVVPSATGGVLYLINAGSSLTVQPWTSTNTYMDSELCHQGLTISGMTTMPADVKCTSVPTGSTWYTSVTSNYPWSGTSAAIPYEWVRINWKENGSESYVSGTGTSTTTSSYSVNPTGAASTAVCWSGSSELLLAAGDPTCEQMTTGTPPTANTPVFLVTALSITTNGSRQMVQAGVAIPPPLVVATPGGFSDPDGFFTNATTCSSSGGSAPFVLSGGALIDGYNSSNGGTYATTKSDSLGSIGTNGSVLLSSGSTKVGGHIHVVHTALTGGLPKSRRIRLWRCNLRRGCRNQLIHFSRADHPAARHDG